MTTLPETITLTEVNDVVTPEEETYPENYNFEMEVTYEETTYSQGGGGDSDFSLHKITIICWTSPGISINVGSLIRVNNDALESYETTLGRNITLEFDAVFYKGVCTFSIFSSDESEIACSTDGEGTATSLDPDYIEVNATGDFTITVTSGGDA